MSALEEPAIVLRRVNKDYAAAGQSIHALQDCNLSVRRGELFGLFGPNGAGKSTLIHVLSTLIAPTSGTAMVCGHSVQQEPLLVRQQIGVLTGAQRAFQGRLTGRENLEFFAALYRVPQSSGSARVHHLLGEFGLADAADRPAQTYSSGMMQRLQLIRVLLHDPPVLLLDEPTNTMDAQTADLVRHLIKDELVGKRGKTVLYTTHDLYEMDRFCDRIAIIHQGRIVAQGAVDDLLAALGQSRRMKLEIAPGKEVALDALSRLPVVASVLAVRREIGSAIVEIELTNDKGGALQAICQALAAIGEQLRRCEPADRDGVGRLLRYHTRPEEPPSC